MYSENVAKAAVPESQAAPVLQSILDRFEKQNAWQSECLSMIEDRLHQILNRRSPEKSQSNELKADVNDFTQAAHKNLSVMETNCNRMERIIGHLREIA